MNSLYGVEFGWRYAIDLSMDTVAMRETHRVTSSETGRVLMADDQMHVLDALQMLLSGCGLATEAELRMRSGDRLLLFTDGLVGACNGNEESFGEQNLVRIARDNPGSSAVDLMGLLIRAAWQHSGEHFQDDASLMVLKATKKGAILDLDGGAQ
jgi:hypothetical protein